MIWDARQLRIAADAAGVALWSWNIQTDEIALDGRACELWDVPQGRSTSFEELSRHIHPADLGRVRAELKATRAVAGPYEVVFRMTRRDRICWISARGHGSDAGAVDDVLFAVFMDVTERRQAEEARDLLAGEMSHRVKNLFSVASALTMISARSAASTEEMADDLTQRFAALGRAHDLIRPMSPQEAEGGAQLKDLLAVLLSPYQERGVGRVRISAPPLHVGTSAATTISLIVHELATNAAKYGALSSAEGSIQVSCSEGPQEVVVVWEERGGPPVTDPAKSPGFGTSLVARSLRSQLGGQVGYDWKEEGLAVTLRMLRSRMAV